MQSILLRNTYVDKIPYVCYNSYMIQKTIAMTPKGTFTLPAPVRKQLGLNKLGDKLLLTFHQKSGTITIEKPVDLRDLQARNAAKAAVRGITPVTDINKVREAKHAERHLN